MSHELNDEQAKPLWAYRWTKTAEERFWSYVNKGDGCWEWTASRSGKGYGVFFHLGFSGRRTSAHRFSWELHNGPVPAGLHVLHHCDNPSCVRPDHLWLGTQSDNSKDMWNKGRGSLLRKVRKTHCIRGHELSGINCRFNRHGHRYCRACASLYQKRRTEDRRAAAQ